MSAGSRVILPREGTFSTQSFWQDVTKYGVTQVIAVPAMLSMLLADAEASSSHAKPSSLRFFWSVGAPLPEPLRFGILEKFGLNVYEVSAHLPCRCLGMGRLWCAFNHAEPHSPSIPRKFHPCGRGVPHESPLERLSM